MTLDECLALTGGPVATASLPRPQPPTDDEIAGLLEFTRAVAHAAERKAAPLAAYAAGVAWGSLPAEARVRMLRAATAAIDAAAGQEIGAGERPSRPDE